MPVLALAPRSAIAPVDDVNLRVGFVEDYFKVGFAGDVVERRVPANYQVAIRGCAYSLRENA